jgi:hypothetical protein
VQHIAVPLVAKANISEAYQGLCLPLPADPAEKTRSPGAALSLLARSMII